MQIGCSAPTSGPLIGPDSLLHIATEAEARDRYDEYQRHANPEAGLAHLAQSASTPVGKAIMAEVNT